MTFGERRVIATTLSPTYSLKRQPVVKEDFAGIDLPSRHFHENWTEHEGLPIRYAVKKPFSSKLRHRAFRAGKLPTPSGDGAKKDAPKDPKRRRRYLGKYR